MNTPCLKVILNKYLIRKISSFISISEFSKLRHKLIKIKLRDNSFCDICKKLIDDHDIFICKECNTEGGCKNIEHKIICKKHIYRCPKCLIVSKYDKHKCVFYCYECYKTHVKGSEYYKLTFINCDYSAHKTMTYCDTCIITRIRDIPFKAKLKVESCLI